MALKKTTYVSGSTIITAENLNDIQDSVISLENTERTSISGGAVTGGANALVTKEVLDATSQLITDEIPSELKNPYALTFTGAASGTYDGSSAVTINIPSGGTLNGNLTGKYITGTWLQTTDASELSTTPEKIAVLDSTGWIYYRTLEHLKSDLGVGSGSGSSNLPDVTTSDNGKFLQVVNGAWSAVSIPSGEGVNF